MSKLLSNSNSTKSSSFRTRSKLGLTWPTLKAVLAYLGLAAIPFLSPPKVDAATRTMPSLPQIFSEEYLTPGSIEVQRLPENPNDVQHIYPNRRNQQRRTPLNFNNFNAGNVRTYSMSHDVNSAGNAVRGSVGENTSNISARIDAIVNTGKAIWKVIQANEPVVDVRVDNASALPQGLRGDWTELSNWSQPRSEKFGITIKNVLGITVAQFTYRVIYISGGSFQGRGRYLAQAAVQPAFVDVMLGFSLNVEASVSKIVNIGTTENPVAGAELNVTMKIKSPLRKMEQTDTYFITGNGELLNNEHSPALNGRP